MRRASPRMGPRIAHPSWCRKGWRTRGCEGGRGHWMVTRRSEAVTGLPVTSRRIGTADRIRTGDVQLGKSFVADRLESHGIPYAKLASGGCVQRGLGEGHLPTFCQKICQNHYPRREPRPLKVTRPTRRQRSRRQRPDPPRSQTSDEQLLWPPLSPKPEGRQRSQIGRARSATPRFFGRVTVPSAVTSAARALGASLGMARPPSRSSAPTGPPRRLPAATATAES